MPIIEHEGRFMVILGVGDVGMARVEDRETKEQLLTIGQMNKSFVIGKENPTEDECFANGFRLCLSSVSRAGWDNLIDILTILRDNTPVEVVA